MARSFFSWLTRGTVRPLNKKNYLFAELLESRDVPSGFHTDHVVLPHSGATPFGSTGPTGTTPAQIKQAYGFNQISFNGLAGDGSGTTIAIVDAYNDPNIASDLHQFDVKFGLPDPVFTKVNQSGGTTMPQANAGWASEIALDVEWAHAIAPRANILLVEANDSSFTNLFAAVSFAAKQPGVVAVSMSWGGGEFSSEANYDNVFKTPAGHIGVTFVVSSGDSGAPASYPATSPNVLSVGGTTLRLDSSGNIISESGWSGSGGGVSAYETKPAYQNGVVTQSSTRRTNPDVSYDADPNTGFPVYDSYNNGSAAPWSQFGGTSDAAPQWAALIAIADQGRIRAGLGSLDGGTQTLPKIYALPASDFRDITAGSSTGSPTLSATGGYDLVTGRGSPIANRIVADLVGATNSPPPATHFSLSVSPTSTVAGVGFTATLTALDANGNVVTGYLGTVHFTSSDAGATLPGNYTFSSADQGVHGFTVILDTAGADTIAAAEVGNSSINGSATESVTPAAPSQLAFGQQPTNTLAGAVINPAVTVRVLDAFGNLETGDNTDQVTISIGNDPAAGTLSGTTTVTVSGGVATFTDLTIDNAGSGYTLIAGSGALANIASAGFDITSTTTGGGGGSTTGAVIEDFESSGSWHIANGFSPTAVLATYAAHDGAYGLDDYAGNDWIYRSDAGAQLHRGDTVSVWLKFAGAADGRAYFGFGASSAGTLSLVAAPNTGQLILQSNFSYGFTNLAAVSQTYQPNHWYRLEVDWGTSGAILGKLFDSDGVTLLKQVSAATGAITSGGIAFRATGSDKYFDTVTASYGVNSFALPAATANDAAPYFWWSIFASESNNNPWSGKPASAPVAAAWTFDPFKRTGFMAFWE
jgi:hypothetical protein